MKHPVQLLEIERPMEIIDDRFRLHVSSLVNAKEEVVRSSSAVSL